MTRFEFTEHAHRRYNPLTNQWILVSPHRNKRPWQGKTEKVNTERRPVYDTACYLCPGNERAGGIINPEYEQVFVFQNDFSALVPDVPKGVFTIGELFRAESEQGFCRVICYSPRHDLTIPEMAVSDIRKIVDIWCDEFRQIGSLDYINYVQIFENKGDIMGCSNPHPHGQIWAQYSVPDEPAKESQAQRLYYEKYSRSMLSDYLAEEEKNGDRLVVRNEHFTALVPFWAIWPFECMIISRRHVQNILQLNDAEKTDLADIYKKLTTRYDNLFDVSFPYSAGLHQAPTDGNDHPEWHLHMHFYPPLLRSASVRKFMVGYEMLANPQRDITPEQSAAQLRSLPAEHYLKFG
jgi:UDPglucose--hexose-1-phosphate uridylyltransferase